MNRAIALATFALAACATAPKPGWVDAGLTFEPRGGGFTVAVPLGWMRANDDAQLFTTRDGPLLQWIGVRRTKVGEPLKNTKKVIAAEMLPQEVADIVADDIASNEEVKGAQIVEKAPAIVGGIRGFRVIATYRDATGLMRKAVVYGAVAAPWVYRLSYVAPARHYFEHDVAAFEDVVKSFRPVATRPSPAGEAGSTGTS